MIKCASPYFTLKNVAMTYQSFFTVYILSFLSLSDTDVSVANCKPGWILYRSSCFLFSSDKLIWSEARDYCKAQGALLLKIQEDNEEWVCNIHTHNIIFYFPYFFFFLISYFFPQAFLNNHTIPTSYWVGLTDQTTGQWRWVDDTPYIMNQE